MAHPRSRNVCGILKHVPLKYHHYSPTYPHDSHALHKGIRDEAADDRSHFLLMVFF